MQKHKTPNWSSFQSVVSVRLREAFEKQNFARCLESCHWMQPVTRFCFVFPTQSLLFALHFHHITCNLPNRLLSLWSGLELNGLRPDGYDERHHVSQDEKAVTHWSGCSCAEDSPARLVVKSLALIIVELSVFLAGGCLVAIMILRSVLRPTEEPQPVAGARASKDTGRCPSRPLQPLLGEASALRRRSFLALAFSSAPKDAATFTVCVLRARAQSNEKQNPNPQRDKLLLAHRYWRSEPCESASTRRYKRVTRVNGSFYWTIMSKTEALCFTLDINSLLAFIQTGIRAFLFHSMHPKSHDLLRKHNRHLEQSTCSV